MFLAQPGDVEDRVVVQGTSQAREQIREVRAGEGIAEPVGEGKKSTAVREESEDDLDFGADNRVSGSGCQLSSTGS